MIIMIFWTLLERFESAGAAGARSVQGDVLADVRLRSQRCHDGQFRPDATYLQVQILKLFFFSIFSPLNWFLGCRPDENRFPINVGITSYVATTGEVSISSATSLKNYYWIIGVVVVVVVVADGEHHRRVQRQSLRSFGGWQRRLPPQDGPLPANKKFRWMHHRCHPGH